MTQLADPVSPSPSAEPEIGACRPLDRRRAASPGTSGRQRRRLRPGDRPAEPSTSTSPRPRRWTRPSRPPGPPSRPGARPRSRSAPRSCSASGTSSTSTARRSRRYLTAEHGKVPSDALGEVARGLENLEFATRHPAPAQGRLQRAGQRPASTSTRSASRWASWPASRRSTSRRWCPMWMFAQRDRVRQHVHPQAVGEGPVGLDLHRRAARRGRRPRRRVQRRPRRQGRGRSDPRAPGHRGGLLRRLDADRALHLRDRHAATASASRRWAAPRTT